MLLRILRVIVGFVAACLVAGLSIVLFAFTPVELASLPADAAADRVSEVAGLAVAAATYSAAFAAPFALVAAAIAEWRGIGSWIYYALVGIAIEAMGLLAQFLSEAPGDPSILNGYALTAFLTTGLVSGVVYWLVSGRFAGGPSTSESLAQPTWDEPPKKAAAVLVEQPKFSIERIGTFGRKNRLVAPGKLGEADFQEVADSIGAEPVKARKIGFVAARKAEQVETIETLWEGQETANTAQPGDWIVTNLSADRETLRDKDGNENTYVIDAETFPTIYDPISGENEFGRFFEAKGIVDAIYLSAGFDIVAPWGEKQTADVGYLLLNGDEVYGNNASTFKATYDVLR